MSMSNIYYPTSPLRVTAQDIGGKANNLLLLENYGMDVPKWCVLPCGVNSSFFNESGLDNQIVKLIKGINNDNVQSVSEEIVNVILSTRLGPEINSLIEKAFNSINDSSIAIRSSASCEDGTVHSFAGQFDSYLNVKSINDAKDCVLKCWASAYSSRNLQYRLTNQLPLELSEVACIFQQMIDAEKSGVTFTANPISKSREQMLVSAVYGVGEGLVSGLVDADTFTIDKTNLNVIDLYVGEKTSRVTANPSGSGCVEIKNDDQAETPCLSESEIKLLSEVALDIEYQSGSIPQDIEWAIKGGKLFILQTRDITSDLDPILQKCEDIIWENSNISESFGGITLPLTASFASNVYSKVFSGHANILGVPTADVIKMDSWLGSLLGYHNGRMYYNLKNWYRMIRLSPFYALNRKAFEMSIGLKDPLPSKEAEALSPFDEVESNKTPFLKAYIFVRFVFLFFTVGHHVRRFLGIFNRLYKECDEVDTSNLSAESQYRTFKDYLSKFLGVWKHEIILEQSLSLVLGCFLYLNRKWLPDAPSVLLFELTKQEGILESVEPVTELNHIASSVLKSQTLLKLVNSTENSGLMAVLTARADEQILDLLKTINSYIEKYGYRSANEMKLESPDMKDDSSIFFELLKGAIGVAQSEALESRNNGPKPSKSDPPLEYVKANLNAFQYIVYVYVLKKVKTFLANREQTRFCRSKIFGIARKFMKAIGDRLADQGLIEERDDIFYLRLEELNSWMNGMALVDEHKDIINIRKKELNKIDSIRAPGSFKTNDVLSQTKYSTSGWSYGPMLHKNLKKGDILKGTACSTGTAVADAVVLEQPQDVKGNIIVTYRTDPGWCTILPTASALLVERGSPLTHVAIIARELKIPTVMQVDNLVNLVRTGMTLKVDGNSGTIQVLEAAVSKNPERVLESA